MKKVVYVDMDNVLVDFPSAFPHIDQTILSAYENRKDDIEGIFRHMKPLHGAVESFDLLATHFDTYILSTSPWNNPSAWSDKLEWVKRHIGVHGYKRLILTHHKHLNKGDFLIDDREKNGARDFEGKLILFGSPEFPDWAAVLDELFRVKVIADDPSLLYEHDCGRSASIEDYPEDAQALIRKLVAERVPMKDEERGGETIIHAGGHFLGRGSLMVSLDIDSVGMEFYERDDVPFAFDPISKKCFCVYSVGRLERSTISFADLFLKGHQITKDEAIDLARKMGR